VRYRVGRRSLDRWCIVGGKLSYASLDLSETQLRERVGSILQQVGEEPPPTADRTATELPEGLRAELYSLARDLLPDWMFENPASTHFASTRTPDPETFPEILICPDGALSALPFGILNLSADGYLPLIARHDPVYRWAAGGDECPTKDPGNASPGVIVAAPLPVAGSALWNSNLPRLEYGLTEARALQQWMPRSILLEGEAATKSALFAAWEGAPFLYFACHVVRDADAPYISYLPLSLPPTSAEVEGSVGDGYLDARDVGAVTFRSRPLVVLSACSSGAPYLVRGAQAPGLGEAFLKAGASTVIQTYWSVRDDVEARLMQEAMHAWAVEGTPPARALNAARRDMARNGAFTHPYYWGNAVVVTAATP
jgi:CHAT domain-containing protein